ncbi:MAG: phosphatase PAP2 family protein [Pedobacter sp.]|uniref:phosphatase PAP2 family protein n=1 Tax=Pedobacter sp. TaxID=1411316 RepID=UPI003562EA4E
MLVYYKYWNLEYNKFEHIAFSFLLIDIIAFLFYALYQTYTIRHEDPTFIVPFIYSIDHATNAFPSLHVANTILAYTTIKDLTMHKKYLTILCISIILSTVLIKQHAFLDVIGGIILSVIVIKYYYSTQYGKLWTVAEKYEVKKVK